MPLLAAGSASSSLGGGASLGSDPLYTMGYGHWNAAGQLSRRGGPF